MASTTQKKKSTVKTNSKTKRNVNSTIEKRPIRREVWALICFLVGLFSFIGYFNVDALFITYFCAFIKAMAGYGYYLFPLAVLACAFILCFHHGQPVQARCICTLAIPITFGVLADLIFNHQNYEGIGITELMPRLYESGKAMHSGGLIGGLLSISFKKLFSIYGAIPVFLLGLIGLFMVVLKITPAMIIEKFKNHERREYVPELKSDSVKCGNTTLNSKHRTNGIDIPTDDEPQEIYEEKRVGFFNANPRVKSPAQILEKHRVADSISSAITNNNEEMSITIPIPLQDESSTVSYQNLNSIDSSESAVPFPVKESSVSSPLSNRTANISHSIPKENLEPLTIEEAAHIADVPLSTPEGISNSEQALASSSSNIPPKKNISAAELQSNTDEVAKAVEKKNADIIPVYNFPPVSLLHQGTAPSIDGTQEINTNKERLQATLDSFGVGASICNIIRGPTVTRYDVELETGVKLSKLTNLAGDLALSLGVTGVRIAPIPDKISTVGIEVPNKTVSTVYLRDIIDTNIFKNAASKLTFAIGKDISGCAITGNISKLPHLLIAGTTGSGKSVCMNCLILSILYKSSPDEVRLIMIDPKMVELGIYNGIPHLYIPVVTDPKKAAGALQWSVIEMLKRYRLFAAHGVRDLASYNLLPKEDGEQKLPQVVIVIDELADLMMTAAKEVEESICRVAQMGRAAGVHLVIATQRPSADVITGLMKANIPSRIAFAVSSAMESRIILDQMGAEKLVGSGDMLYAPLGIGKPTRIQGAFVSDEEREDIVNFIKQYGEAQYSDEILASIEQAAKDKSSSTSDLHAESVDESIANVYDELLPQAVDVIFETKQASVSMLQRRLKLGYSRAARIVDQMEEIGVVGPFEGSKPRQILITKEQWVEMRNSPVGSSDRALEAQINFSDYVEEFGEKE